MPLIVVWMIWFSANKRRVITGQHYKQYGTVYETKTAAAMVIPLQPLQYYYVKNALVFCREANRNPCSTFQRIFQF